MTISATYTPAQASGNGVTVAFPFTFKTFEQADLVVIITDADDVDTTQTITTHYTVSLNADQNNNPGGTVTMLTAPASGTTLTIARVIDALQETDIANGGGFYPEVLEDALDRLTMLSQQNSDAIDRSFSLPVTVSGVNTELPVPAANNIVGWNATADALQNFDPSVFATVVSFGTAKADIFDGDGVTLNFTLTANPGAQNNLDVSISGVTQTPGIDYTWSAGTTISFVVAPPVGTDNVLVRYMQGLANTNAQDAAFTPAGTGAVETTIKTKLREFVSVKDFGAVGDGVTDDAAAIQAAIDANPGDRIMFPNGKYLIGTTLTITTPGTRLEGVTAGRWYFTTGDSGAVIICNAATTAVHFNNSASPAGTLHGCGMANIGIARTSDIASGSGLKLTDTSNFIGSNLAIDEFFICLDLDGAQACTFDNIRCYTGNVFTGAANSKLISVSGLAAGSTDVDAGWINSFDQCVLTSNLISDYGIFIEAGDSTKFANTYVGLLKLANCFIRASGDDVPLYTTAFDNVYFDGAALNGLGTPVAVYVKDDGHIPASKPTVYDLKFSDCTFAQVNTALYIDDADIAAINVVGCEFHNVMETAVYISALTGINDGQFNFTGTTFRTIGYDNVGNNWAAIRMDGGADGLVVSGCVFDDIKDNTYVIHINGTLKNLSVTGCSFVSDASHQFTDIYTTGATINQFAYSGNVSTSTLAPSMGYRPGNVANADANALDWYEEGTFTPVLTFSTPGNVSVTYTNQVARYTRIGNRVHAQIDILTSAFTHTTASGNLTITGMPAAITPRATGARWQGALEFQGITKATYTNFVMAAIANDPKLYVSAGGSGVARSLVTAADMPSGGTVIINAQLTWEV